MQHTLRYRSSRGQVWRWYWRAWLARLWKIHVAVAVLLSFAVSVTKVNSVDYMAWAIWFLALLPVITVLFAAFPQIMFKNSERTLTVDSRGWFTQIGSKSGSKTWNEVESIRENAGSVVITGKNGNALIIPDFAFVASPTRQQFVADTQRWKEEYVG